MVLDGLHLRIRIPRTHLRVLLMPDLDDIKKVLASGRRAGWVKKPCMVCSRPAKFPAGLVLGTDFEDAPAICEHCELKRTPNK